MKFPIPEGLEMPDVPAGETLVLPVTFTVEDGMLSPIDIDGFPIAEAEDDEMEVSEDADFVTAVNSQLPQ